MVSYTAELTRLNEQVVDIEKSFENQKTFFFFFLQANYYIISSTWLDPHNLGWIRCRKSRHRSREQPESWRIVILRDILTIIFNNAKVICYPKDISRFAYHQIILTWLIPPNQKDISVFCFPFLWINMLIIKMIYPYLSLLETKFINELCCLTSLE